MLTDKQIKAIEGTGKLQRITDMAGLFLEVTPSGSKSWGLRFRLKTEAGLKARTMGLGSYPIVTLAIAREKAQEYRKLVKQGIDPVLHRRVEKLDRAVADDSTFGAVLGELIAKKREEKKTEKYIRGIEQSMEKYVLPTYRSIPIDSIKAPHLISLLRKVHAGKMPGSGKAPAPTVAYKLAFMLQEVFGSARNRGLIENNPAENIAREIPAHTKQSHPHITDFDSLGVMLRKLDVDANTYMPIWFRLQSYLFVRPTVLSHAPWSEFDLDAGLWRIPAERMKMRDDFDIPLPVQAVAMLRKLRAMTGRTAYLFPQTKGKKRDLAPIDRVMPQAYLVRKGYEDLQTAHGFRATASTILREARFERDLVEVSLSHGPKNEVERAYMHGKFAAPRKVMMQAYADFLDAVREGKDKPDCMAILKQGRLDIAALDPDW